jgi:hypothetical protein
MKTVLARLGAMLMLAIPGVVAAYGFLKMKNAFFDYFADLGNMYVADPTFDWGQFIWGALLFLAGVGFIGGWIFYRDRKRNYVAPRFRSRRSLDRDGQNREEL